MFDEERSDWPCLVLLIFIIPLYLKIKIYHTQRNIECFLCLAKFSKMENTMLD